jgi:hypothetical protein
MKNANVRYKASGIDNEFEAGAAVQILIAIDERNGVDRDGDGFASGFSKTICAGLQASFRPRMRKLISTCARTFTG